MEDFCFLEIEYYSYIQRGLSVKGNFVCVCVCVSEVERGEGCLRRHFSLFESRGNKRKEYERKR